MKRCQRCHNPFGLVRQTLGYCWWEKAFCSRTCADAYAHDYEQERRVWQYLSWLHPKPP